MIKIPVDRFINYQSINRKNQTYEMIITNFNLNQKTASKNKKFIIFKRFKKRNYLLNDFFYRFKNI
ncbi:MAG: hypothetical protein Q8755_00985 [Candidatus Phytoplasma australasiaticum]|nr:hypothetical protein [Candidatus Phytoplasma australasiaticum]MDV3138933.1 hypothetical protein [Candidatus Phytoplasma australasiaticum]MDV3140439.1 hypothetical protein [Candidatus Phytoplasma australasiaticum]MDV3141215.1 hypothetical protein [Candidatus Phytoplasma australasiaticum]MDV3152960.1 hypothetical protein [Candidatus Phytoplasma australasiaticum]